MDEVLRRAKADFDKGEYQWVAEITNVIVFADPANEKVAAPDYIHFNSMDLDADGNLSCSFRHIHSILCLDRGESENPIK